MTAQKKGIFTENVTDFFSKTDSLPFFTYEKAELDTLIALNRLIPISAEIYGVKCEEQIGFKVDRKNKIVNVKHYKTDIVLPRNVEMKDYRNYDSLKLYFQKESERLMKLTDGLWYSDSVKAEKEIRYKIVFVSDGFDKLNKKADYFNTKGSQGIGVTTYNLGSPTSLQAKKDLYNYGVRKFAIKRTALAKVYFEESVRYFYKDIDAHYNLATCYYKLKDKEKACKHWNICLELGDASVSNELNQYCK